MDHELRKIITKDGHQPVLEYIGKAGELFYDVDSRVLRISDGETAGGQVISGGSGGFEYSDIQEGFGNSPFAVTSITGQQGVGVGLTSDLWAQLMWVPNAAVITLDDIATGPEGPYGWAYMDSNGFFIKNQPESPDSYEWNFTTDGQLLVPEVSRITAGRNNFDGPGYSSPNRAEMGTDIYYSGNNIDESDFVVSEVFLGAGYGEFRSIHNINMGDKFGLTYAGVEDTQAGRFSGVVSQTPGMQSMYTVGTNTHDNIILGAAQYEGSLVASDWATALGTFNERYNINGIYTDRSLTNVSGGTVASSKLVLTDAGVKVVTQIDNYTGPNPGPYWYNAYGNIQLESSEYTAGASLAYASDGSLYMLGAYLAGIGQGNDTLALKYDSVGNIVWRKDWTDADGLPCGSFNNVFAIDHDDNDNLYWVGTSYAYNRQYLGINDRDGNNIRIPLQLNDFEIRDMQLVDNTGNVCVVGARYIDGQLQPAISIINFKDEGNSFNANTCVSGSIAGQTNIWNSVSMDPGTGQFVTMGTYTNSSSQYHPMIKLWAHDGTPGSTYDVSDGLDPTHQYDGIAAYFDNSHVYSTFIDYGDGCSYVTKYNHFDLSTKLWQVKIGDANDTFVYDLAFDNTGNVYVGGVSMGYNPPTTDTDLFLWKLNHQTGDIIWNLSMGSEADEGLAGDLGPGEANCRGLAVYEDRVAMTGYTVSFVDSHAIAVTFQLPTDGSIDNLSSYGTFIHTWNLGYANGDFANAVVITDTIAYPPLTVTNAALLATTNTYSTTTQEYHYDILSDSVIYPPERRNEWQFDVNGVIHLPQAGDILDSNGRSVIRDSVFPYSADLQGNPVILDISKDIHILVDNSTYGYELPNGTVDGQTIKLIAGVGITDITQIQVNGYFAVISSNAVSSSSINWNPFSGGGGLNTFNTAVWYKDAWHAIL